MTDFQRSPTHVSVPQRSARLSLLGVSLLAAGLLSACSIARTPYEAPQPATPARWAQAPASAASASTARVRPPVAAASSAEAGSPRTQIESHWWTAFNDPVLTRLIDTALERNADMAVAALTLRQARLTADLDAANEWPSVSASVSTSASHQLKSPHTTSHSHSASLSVSYEADLWGRLSATTDAARWEAKATEQDREATALSLVGTVADLYWELGYLNQRVTWAQASLDYALRTRELVGAQYAAGSVSGLEVAQADQTIYTNRTTLSQLEQTRVETRNALAILFDAAPGDETLNKVLSAEPQSLPTQPPPEIAAGLPAELLGRRPDLRAAELRLRETLASGDATRASYYPQITLTGSLGGSSTALRKLLSDPIGTLGAELTLPFLQFRQMRINDQLAQAEYESAVISYRKTLYSAFSDVENALSARQQLARQNEWLGQSLTAARRVEKLYETQYRQGQVALVTWLDAQETRRQAEVSYAENLYSLLEAQVTLYQALGGN